MKGSEARQAFNQAKAMLTKYGIDAESAKLTQSFLRMEVIVNSTTTNYQLGVINGDMVNGKPQRQTERRLNQQDVFFVSSLQVLIGVASSETATNFDLVSWNSPLVFTTTNADTALNNFYNGIINLTVNGNVIAPAWDLLKHKNVPQTQLTGATNSPKDERHYKEAAVCAVEPNWVLQGNQNNLLTIQLPGAIDTLQASATTVIAVIARGVLAQNVTKTA